MTEKPKKFIIQLTSISRFGKKQFMPNCKLSEVILEISKKKTFTLTDINKMYASLLFDIRMTDYEG